MSPDGRVEGADPELVQFGVGRSGAPVAARRTVPYDRRAGERRRSADIEERYRVAVLLPCRDEVLTIGQVVSDFAAALPEAAIWVYDNNSTDGTAEVALSAGASVQEEPLPGKGHVMRRMFAEVDADIYVVADGDGTYDALAAPLLIEHLVTNASTWWWGGAASCRPTSRLTGPGTDWATRY